MFNNNKPKSKSMKNNEMESSSVNIIGSGTVIDGDVKTGSDIRVDGVLNGSLDSKGKVVIGATGTVDGEINCQNADVSGTIKARITVAKLLQLKSTAKITGDIVTNKLSVEPGATFTGSCSMGAVIKEFQHERKTAIAERQEKTA